mmetsp:Transcript_507/g.1739  ORF Transcript_507/g.1739 Transcript_507/m.1739 type:complete len:259 (-) Transcript_507:880-1656(-)
MTSFSSGWPVSLSSAVTTSAPTISRSTMPSSSLTWATSARSRRLPSWALLVSVLADAPSSPCFVESCSTSESFSDSFSAPATGAAPSAKRASSRSCSSWSAYFFFMRLNFVRFPRGTVATDLDLSLAGVCSLLFLLLSLPLAVARVFFRSLLLGGWSFLFSVPPPSCSSVNTSSSADAVSSMANFSNSFAARCTSSSRAVSNLPVSATLPASREESASSAATSNSSLCSAMAVARFISSAAPERSSLSWDISPLSSSV